MVERAKWVDLRPYIRAMQTVTDVLCYMSPQERWKWAYRQERLKQRGMMKSIFGPKGEIGTLYGVKVVTSRDLQ